MDSGWDTCCQVGFPIRIFTDQSLLAAPHDFSQRATSFIASQCQGIHQMPLRRLISLDAHAQGQTRTFTQNTQHHFRFQGADLTADQTPSAESPTPCKADPWSHFTKPFSRCPRTGSPCCLQSQVNLQPIRLPTHGSQITTCKLNIFQRSLVEADGIEPTTSCLQSTRSPN